YLHKSFATRKIQLLGRKAGYEKHVSCNTNKSERGKGRVMVTYIAYATGAATSKKTRKFKKPASPSKKRTLVIVEEEEPEPAKKVVSSQKPSRKQPAGVVFKDTLGVVTSKKKTQTTTDKSKGIDLLYDVVVPEAAQLKKVLKRSKQGKSIHEASGSGDGTGPKPGVPDEPKGKSGDSSDEANVQGDDEDVLESDDDLEQADVERTDSENQKTTEEDEESDNAFVHTLEDYVPVDDETNDEFNDVDEEEYERISEELYGDVNVRLTDAKPTDEEKGNKEMTNPETVNVEHEEGSQEVAGD
nr:hypothetical protein [Tanacetum cinerariifolium]